MKKLSIFALAALLVVAFTVPAAALENTFGGYWNTRFSTLSDNDATKTGLDDDDAKVTSRLRLYYTAGINDNLKIVTKFEIDYGWGDTATTVTGTNAAGVAAATVQGGIGDVGADGKASIEVKNIYADFNLGPVNAKIGTQSFAIGRGMMIDDDVSGAVITYNVNDMISIPVVWFKYFEGGAGNAGEDQDVDVYALAPVFKFGEGISVQGILAKVATDDANGINALPAAANAVEVDALYYGIDASAAFGPLSLFGVAILQGGETETAGVSTDLSGTAFNLGAAYDMGMFSVHAEYMMLSGDDGTAPRDNDAWTTFGGESLNKGELFMNNGIFWGHGPANGPGSAPSGGEGLVLYNIGGVIKPMDKLSIKPDIYMASRDDAAAGAGDDYGTEFDLVISYELVEGLNADFVAAHWNADDGVTNTIANDEEDVTLYGLQLSVSW